MRVRFPPPVLAALVEGLEGAALVGFACYVGVKAAVGRPTDAWSAVALAVTIAVLGLGALLVCRGLYRGRRWSRAPALVTQILAIPIAVSFLRGGQLEVGLSLLAVCAVGFGALLGPATIRTFSARGSEATPPG